MSLEESMKDLAESNRELAKAQRYYAGVIEKFGLKVESDNTGKTPAPAASTPEKAPKTETAAQKKAREKAEKEAKAKKDEDDGFGDEPEQQDEQEDEDEIPSELTLDIVKAKLFEVKDAYGDKTPALAIIQKLGYDAIPNVKAKDFEKVYRAAVKALKDAS